MELRLLLPLVQAEKPYLAELVSLWHVLRMGRALSRVGTSVITTSVCNGFAFGISSISSIPATRHFAIQATVGVAVNLILQLTALSSLLAIYWTYMSASPAEILSRKESEPSADPRNGADVTSTAVAESWAAKVMRVYSPLMLRGATVPVLLAIAMLGSVAAGIYGCTQVEQGLLLQEAVPEDSYLIPYYDRLDDYFTNVGPPLYVVTKALDYTDLEIQRRIESITFALDESAWSGSPPINWQVDFRAWCIVYGGYLSEMVYDEEDKVYRPPPDRYYGWLEEYMMSECGRDQFGLQQPCGRAKALDIKLNKGGQYIESARIQGRYIGLKTTRDYVKAMLDVRKAIDAAGLQDAF
eukprot:scaffold60_cov382-Prasinococcus_capsulatus_cf.AAC.1